MSTDAKSPISHIPHIHLLCMEDKFIPAFNQALKAHALPPDVLTPSTLTIHNCSLAQLDPSAARFDTIVSPANSYARLDGAFDDAISRAISPRDDYLALTHACQAELYRQWRGYAPPGTCTLVDVPRGWEVGTEGKGGSKSRNVWGVRRVAVVPTMRMPCDARWDREIVYECTWSLLCAIDNHNRRVRESKSKSTSDTTAATGGGEEDDEDEIRSILMTPFATGIGRVSPERWASQTVLAIKHFAEASAEPERWGRLPVGDIWRVDMEIEPTWMAAEDRKEGK